MLENTSQHITCNFDISQERFGTSHRRGTASQHVAGPYGTPEGWGGGGGGTDSLAHIPLRTAFALGIQGEKNRINNTNLNLADPTQTIFHWLALGPPG